MRHFFALCAAIWLADCPLFAQVEEGSQSGDVNWVTLGTGGGPVIRTERGQPANALIVGNAVYLFDLGPGTMAKIAEAGLDSRDVRAIFLSHHHIDHTGDVGPLLINRWVLSDYHPLAIFGPSGTVQVTDAVVALSAPVALAPITIGGPTKPEISATWIVAEFPTEIDYPQEVFRDDNVRVIAITNAHYHFATGSEEDRFSRSYAFRVEAGNKSYVYTGDTGPTDKLVTLARGADVLVTEVIDMEAIELTLRRRGYPADVLQSLLAHMEEDHLTPVEIGRLASAAGVGRVVLTHLVPGNDDETDLSGYLEGIADVFDGPVSIANDLERF